MCSYCLLPKRPKMFGQQPDANTGATIFLDARPGDAPVGSNSSGVFPPSCDWPYWNHEITPGCGTLIEPTLPVGIGISAPIAEVWFMATAAGTDEIVFDYDKSALYDWDKQIRLCNALEDTPCFGAPLMRR